jgi:hypothetical protein
MVGNRQQNDTWIADIASFVRMSFGNEADMVSPEEVARIRAETRHRDSPYSFTELMASVPGVLQPSPDWVVAASHSGPVIIGGSEEPAAAFGHEGWTSGAPQKDGMWFEIRFPKKVRLAEIRFDAPANGLPWQAAEKPPAFPRGLVVKAATGSDSWKTIGTYQPGQQRVRISFGTRTLDRLRLELSDVPSDIGPIPWSMRQLKLYGWADSPASSPNPSSP